KYESSIHVTKSSGKSLLFHLEPWGDQIEMGSGATFVLCAEAAQPGSFEIERGEDEIIVWAWPTASVKIFSEGSEIGMPAGVERRSLRGFALSARLVVCSVAWWRRRITNRWTRAAGACFLTCLVRRRVP